MSMLPYELVYRIFKYLDLDVQWSLRDQSHWEKKWLN
jgi:hypothetical protein